MRNPDGLPAWVARQRNRLLGRHSDEKVVRWINHSHNVKGEPAPSRPATEAPGSDNVVAFAPGRSVSAC